jgi:hypothetical protein
MAVDYALLGTSVSQFFSGVYVEWMMLAALLLMISTGIAGLVYMIGALLSNDRVKAWAKKEIVEIFYSIVLVALTLSLLGVADGVVQNLAYGSGGPSSLVCGSIFSTSPYYYGVPCHIRLGMYFMNSLFNEGKGMAYEIYLKYALTSAIAEINVNTEVITEKAGVNAYNPLKGFFMIGNTIKANMFDFIIKIMTLSKFQEVMLRFVALALFPVMFVLGAVLRSFFFTRKLGGLLMAMALALYFVLPMFYVMGGVFYSAFKEQAVADSCNRGACDPDASAFRSLYLSYDGMPAVGGSGVVNGQPGMSFSTAMAADKKQYDTAEFDYAFYGDPQNDPSRQTPTAVSQISAGTYLDALDLCKKMTTSDPDVEAKAKATQLEDQSKIWLTGLTSKSFYNPQVMLFEYLGSGGYIDAVSRLTFFSVFFSFVGLMATIASIKSLSALFGGDLEIAGLTHLI